MLLVRLEQSKPNGVYFNIKPYRRAPKRNDGVMVVRRGRSFVNPCRSRHVELYYVPLRTPQEITGLPLKIVTLAFTPFLGTGTLFWKTLRMFSVVGLRGLRPCQLCSSSGWWRVENASSDCCYLFAVRNTVEMMLKMQFALKIELANFLTINRSRYCRKNDSAIIVKHNLIHE